MMGKNSLRTIVTFGFLAGLASGSAHADYTMAVVDGTTGESSVALSPGDAVSLAVVLDGDADDSFDSVGFYLVFSSEGLRYESFAWDSAAFDTGGEDDFSMPARDDLPQTITADSYTLDSQGEIDISFEAVTRLGAQFGSGTLVVFDLTVPVDYPSGDVLIDVVPDFIALGFETVEPVAGDTFTLSVVSEPLTPRAGGDDGTGEAPPSDPDEPADDEADDSAGDGDDTTPGDSGEAPDTGEDDAGGTADSTQDDGEEPADTGSDDMVDESGPGDESSEEGHDGEVGSGEEDGGDPDGSDADETDPSIGPRVGRRFCGIGMLGTSLFVLLGLITGRLCRSSVASGLRRRGVHPPKSGDSQ